MELLNNGKIAIDDEILSLEEAKVKYPEKKVEIQFHEIAVAASQILELPEIKNTSNIFDKAYLLYKYIIENSKYDLNIQKEKKLNTEDDIEFNEIYRCLCEHRSVCTGDSASLSLLMRMVGIESVYVGLRHKTNNSAHAVVKFKIDNNEYFCDPTLFRLLSIEHNVKINNSLFAFPSDSFFSTFHPKEEIEYIAQPESLVSITLKANKRKI